MDIFTLSELLRTQRTSCFSCCSLSLHVYSLIACVVLLPGLLAIIKYRPDTRQEQLYRRWRDFNSLRLSSSSGEPLEISSVRRASMNLKRVAAFMRKHGQSSPHHPLVRTFPLWLLRHPRARPSPSCWKFGRSRVIPTTVFVRLFQNSLSTNIVIYLTVFPGRILANYLRTHDGCISEWYYICLILSRKKD